MSLFTSEELRRFMHFLPNGRSLAYELPSGGVSLSQLAFEVTLTLQRHGSLDQNFFERLISERPGRRDEIEMVRAVVLGDSPPIVHGGNPLRANRERQPGEPFAHNKSYTGLVDSTGPRDGFDFFLIHASPDKKRAGQLYDLLTGQSGGRVFLDDRSLLPGADWTIEIPRALERSRIVVVLLSQHMASAWLDLELRHAIKLYQGGNIRLVPVYLDGWMKEVPDDLKPLHGLNARDLGLDGVATSLLSMLSSQEGGKPTVSASSVKPERSRDVPKELLQLTQADEDQFIRRLEATMAMVDTQVRSMVLERLEPEIRTRIPHSSSLRLYLTNVVQICARYIGGIEQLVEAVRWFEGDSRAMREIDDFMSRITSRRAEARVK